MQNAVYVFDRLLISFIISVAAVIYRRYLWQNKAYYLAAMGQMNIQTTFFPVI